MPLLRSHDCICATACCRPSHLQLTPISKTPPFAAWVMGCAASAPVAETGSSLRRVTDSPASTPAKSDPDSPEVLCRETYCELGCPLYRSHVRRS